MTSTTTATIDFDAQRAALREGRQELRNVSYADLREGDLVLDFGMIVEISGLRTHRASDGRRELVYAWRGRVLNNDEVDAEGVVPKGFRREEEIVEGRTVVRYDAWTVQGNDLARALVWRKG